ncbi:MAG TPA: diadenylate cyclase CdaA [Sphingobacteriaceae bacterium]|nr:diadenylate cyclase CdaA [Sphingobacteriaceae bacterium]
MISLARSLTFLDVVLAVIDILIVAYIIYRFFLLIRGTRATAIITGLAVVLVATPVSRWLRLETLHWLLGYAQIALLVGIPILFQPELRRALEQVGQGGLFRRSLSYLGQEPDVSQVIQVVADAARTLSRNRTGAIIVIERTTGLGDVAETGIPIDGLVSKELLINLFLPRTPLHDGAVIIRGDRVVAAGCFLPLTDQPLDISLGSRHRAAVGISEHSDAVAVVVSEETGAISIAHGGKLIQKLDDDALRQRLTNLLLPAAEGNQRPFLFGQRNKN